jgi:hypothetical protein
MANLYDKTGREIVRGDVLKVYHYTAALRRKRIYMFKQALGVETLKSGNEYMQFSHLNMREDSYLQVCDGKHLRDYEIVQSIDAKFEERPRRRIHLTPEPASV